ncbi:Hypothetical predicted protein [Pelobates cultripes]|uniref:Uncharacterized protein n=1 Tax=Pelobates cultripes TaxID=61616 RepID=A0AAD1T4G6_PELCU|nr:Hypothetical predicted protein [Pelobates cultripes]
MAEATWATHTSDARGNILTRLDRLFSNFWQQLKSRKLHSAPRQAETYLPQRILPKPAAPPALRAAKCRRVRHRTLPRHMVAQKKPYSLLQAGVLHHSEVQCRTPNTVRDPTHLPARRYYDLQYASLSISPQATRSTLLERSPDLAAATPSCISLSGWLHHIAELIPATRPRALRSGVG